MIPIKDKYKKKTFSFVTHFSLIIAHHSGIQFDNFLHGFWAGSSIACIRCYHQKNNSKNNATDNNANLLSSFSEKR